jgi:uncharacterized SAM-binding protein YcdF (DUF218 family)
MRELGSRLPDTGSQKHPWYDRRAVILAAFLASLVLVVGGTVYVVLEAIRLWRQVKSTGRAFSTELSRFDERASRTERLLAEADASSATLVQAQERLRVSLARLDVLRSALESSRLRTSWLRAYIPPR